MILLMNLQESPMNKLKELPDLTSRLTNSIELTAKSKDYGKIGTEKGKFGHHQVVRSINMV